MITARYRFVDISGSKAETRVRLSRINEVAVLALADALRACSNAWLYQVDILQRFVVRQRGANLLPLLNQFSIPGASGDDVFHAWIPSIGVNDRDVADILSSQFATRLGDDLGEPTWEPYADLPVLLEPRYASSGAVDNGWRLVLIRDQFWRELVADARRYNTQSLFSDDNLWASTIRRDIYDLRRGMDVNEILQRLDRIIELLEEGGQLDPYIVEQFDDVEELLGNIIIALGAP